MRGENIGLSWEGKVGMVVKELWWAGRGGGVNGVKALMPSGCVGEGETLRLRIRSLGRGGGLMTFLL